MANARLEELKARFDENPRRYFAPYANELRKTGDLAQAISICRSHLAVQPGHVSGHIVLAQALSESGELDESRGEFEAALELDPENLIALRAMGDLARARGDAAVAREWYQRVLDADPRNEEIARTLRDMAGAPNEFSPPPSAPAPLSMLVPDPPLSGHAFDEAVPPTDSAPPGDHAAPVVPSRTQDGASDAPAATAPRVVEPAPEVPPPRAPDLHVPEPQALDLAATVRDESVAEPAESFDDFIPFDSIDSIGTAGDDEFAPPPPKVAAEAIDLSDFTMMDPDPTKAEPAAPQGAEEPATPQPEGAEFAATWSEMDELSLNEGPAAPTSDGEPAHDANDPTDTGWMTRPTPAADLSDYEAAPEPFFEDQPSAASSEPARAEMSPNGVNPPSQPGYEDDIESWFNTRETAAPAQQSELPDRTDDAPGGESAEPASAGSTPPTSPEPEWAASSADAVGRTPTRNDAVPETHAAPFVTETLAELYLQQGFRDEALAIYRQLIDRNPADESLRRRAEAIERGAASDVVPDLAARTSTTGHRASMSVRTFFGRLARRAPSRPATGSGSDGGSGRSSRTTGSWESVGARQAPDTPSTQMGLAGYGTGPSQDVASATREAAQPVDQPSALATLFAASHASEADTRAATALAAAFTEAPSSLAPSGRPSRTAERELSLDHLFREDADNSGSEGAPAAGTMDEFYRAQSPGAAAPEAGASGAANPSGPAPGGAGRAPDERNTDLRQFTAWLEGLKKK